MKYIFIGKKLKNSHHSGKFSERKKENDNRKNLQKALVKIYLRNSLISFGKYLESENHKYQLKQNLCNAEDLKNLKQCMNTLIYKTKKHCDRIMNKLKDFNTFSVKTYFL